MTECRILGAKKLTAIVGLDSLVEFKIVNALELPFDDQNFDVVISQEAFCHLPNKGRLIAECVRVLKPGGRITFTDILATGNTNEEIRRRLQCEMALFELGTQEEYLIQLVQEGCDVIDVQNLSDEWRSILIERLSMYRSLKGQTVEKYGSQHFAKWDNAYSFFVGLYQTENLGGGRFLARRHFD